MAFSNIPHVIDDIGQNNQGRFPIDKSNSESKLSQNTAINSSVNKAMEAMEKETKPLDDGVGEASNNEDHEQMHWMMNKHLGESMLFSNDDLVLINNPGIVDFLEAYSLDLMSHYYL